MIEHTQSNGATFMPRFRPRISILTALLLMTIVGMVFAVIHVRNRAASLELELRKLTYENRQLRDEVGALSIDDPSKIHAIRVRTEDDRTWKWRVWVPEGMTVEVRYQCGDVPRAGVPRGQSGALLNSGEQWVSMKVRRDRSGKNWMAYIETKSGSNGSSIKNESQWFDWDNMAVSVDGVDYTTKVDVDESKPFILERHRAAKVNSSAEIKKMATTAAGFIVWLEHR